MAECSPTVTHGNESEGGEENGRLASNRPVRITAGLRRPLTLSTPMRRRGRGRGRGRESQLRALGLPDGVRALVASRARGSNNSGLPDGVRALVASRARGRNKSGFPDGVRALVAPRARGRNISKSPRLITRIVCRKRCKPHLCRPCNRTYLRKEQYEKHIQICHSGQSLVCQVCNTDMCCQYHYDVHVKHHTTRTEYVCQFCQRASPTIEWLRLHVEEHIGQTPLLCDQCELDFQSKIEMSVAPKLMCFAPMIFKSVEELNVHIKFRHQTLVAATADTADVPGCCGKPGGSNHLNHWPEKETKASRLVCSCCLRNYDSDYELQVHRERNAILRSNGTMGCGMYELFNLCLDGKNLVELGLREVKLRALLKQFLEIGFHFQDRDFLYMSTESLLVKFCRQLLDDEDMSDILLITPITDLVSEMVFVLKEIWPLDQTYTREHIKQEVL